MVEIKDILVWAILLVGIAYILSRSIGRAKGKGRLSKQASQDQAALNLRDRTEIQHNLSRLLVDLQELAREISGQIDTRFCKLDVLIRQADERIRRLEELQQIGGGGDTETTPAAEPLNPEHEMVYKLADAGKGPVEIARELNKHRGEVELILSLRKSSNDNRIDFRIDD